MSESVDIVHILKPATVPFCDSDCSRAECREAIKKSLPLPCEAVSVEDFKRVANNLSVSKTLVEIFDKKSIYKFGLAVLVVTTAYENRKKYSPDFLGRAIFAYLRAGRHDDGYTKRTIALLHEVMKEPDHFSWADLETMFGKDVVDVLRFLNLPLTPENFFIINKHPLASELYEYTLRAHLDWAELIQDEVEIKNSKRVLNYLISLKEKNSIQ